MQKRRIRADYLAYSRKYDPPRGLLFTLMGLETIIIAYLVFTGFRSDEIVNLAAFIAGGMTIWLMLRVRGETMRERDYSDLTLDPND